MSRPIFFGVIEERCQLLKLSGMGDNYMNMEHWRNDTYCENWCNWRQTCISASL